MADAVIRGKYCGLLWSTVIGGIVIGKNTAIKAGSVIAKNVEGTETRKYIG